MRLAGIIGLVASVWIPMAAQAQIDRGQQGRPTQPSAVAPVGVAKSSIYSETEYVSGHEGFTQKKKGQLVVTADGVGFFDNKGQQVFAVPIRSIRNAEHNRDIRDPSVGKKLLFGALAGDRKQDFLTLTTETDSTAEGIVFKVKQNVATGIVAKVNFYARKAHGDNTEAPEAGALVSETSAVTVRPVAVSGSGSASAPAPTSNPAFRSNNELNQNTEFRLATGDAQRLGLVTGYREIGPDTLAVDLSDEAMTSTSTEPHLGRVFAGYRSVTSRSQGSTLLLQHGGQSVGEFTTHGLARGDWR
jgi:hypothetical protein